MEGDQGCCRHEGNAYYRAEIMVEDKRFPVVHYICQQSSWCKPLTLNEMQVSYAATILKE